MATTPTEPDPPTRGPLAGVLVVALEQAVAAPLCTARLAAAGARVIKVERDSGDFSRSYDSAAGGDSSYFLWANHGKESLVLDITDPEDAALLHRIIGRADVFVQNLGAGAAARAGFDVEVMRDANPRLITCDITGFASDSPMAGRPAYDLLIQTESGIVGVSGGPGELGRVGVSLCDIGAGMTAHAAILESLIERERTGRGTHLEIPLFDVAAEWMTVPLIQHQHDGVGPERVGLRHPSIAPYGAYRTDDGARTVIAIQNEREWVRLASALGRPELASDPRFTSNIDRVANRSALEAELDAAIAALDRDELRARLTENRIAWGAVSELADVSDHPALRRRDVTSSTGVSVSIPATPSPWVQPQHDRPPRVPTIGEHTASIRAEFSRPS